MSAILASPKGWPSILLARAGAADPTDLDAAHQGRRVRGAAARDRVLGPAGTIAEIEASGPARPRRRGPPDRREVASRGRDARAGRYVVANGYGADPSASTDRTLLESDPYAVIEGAAIAAFAIGGRGRVHLRPGDRDRGRPIGSRRRSTPRRPATSSARTRSGSGRRIEVTVRDRPGRLHARRGDGPAEGPRREARPARAAPAASGDARLPQRADGRPERADPRRRALDPRPPREGVRRDRPRRRPGHDPRRRPRPRAQRRRRGPDRVRRSSASPALGGRPGEGGR